MQVNKIQSTQPNFGTRVKMDFETLDTLRFSASLRKQFAKFVKELESNGRTDTFVMTKGPGDFNTCAFVSEMMPAKKPNGFDLYRQSETKSFDMLSYMSKGAMLKKIKSVYNSCYKNMSQNDFWPRRINEDLTQYLI